MKDASNKLIVPSGGDLDALFAANKTKSVPVWMLNSLHTVMLKAVNVLRAGALDRDARIAALTLRIDELERRPAVQWKGTWVGGRAYVTGSLATYKGSLWLAVEPTAAQPGTNNSGWKLVVKQGAYA
jgi:hypothetical protein